MGLSQGSSNCHVHRHTDTFCNTYDTFDRQVYLIHVRNIGYSDNKLGDLIRDGDISVNKLGYLIRDGDISDNKLGDLIRYGDISDNKLGGLIRDGYISDNKLGDMIRTGCISDRQLGDLIYGGYISVSKLEQLIRDGYMSDNKLGELIRDGHISVTSKMLRYLIRNGCISDKELIDLIRDGYISDSKLGKLKRDGYMSKCVELIVDQLSHCQSQIIIDSLLASAAGGDDEARGTVSPESNDGTHSELAQIDEHTSAPTASLEIKNVKYFSTCPMKIMHKHFHSRKRIHPSVSSVKEHSMQLTPKVPKEESLLSLHNRQTVVVKTQGTHGLKMTASEVKSVLTSHTFLKEIDITRFYKYEDPGRWYMELKSPDHYERLHGWTFKAEEISYDIQHLDKEQHRVEFSWVPVTMTDDKLIRVVKDMTGVECQQFSRSQISDDIRVTLIDRDIAEILPNFIILNIPETEIHKMKIQVHGRRKKRSLPDDDSVSNCESEYSVTSSDLDRDDRM